MHCASCDGYFIINVPHLSVFCGLGKVVLHDNIIYLVSSYIVFFCFFFVFLFCFILDSRECVCFNRVLQISNRSFNPDTFPSAQHLQLFGCLVFPLLISPNI